MINTVTTGHIQHERDDRTHKVVPRHVQEPNPTLQRVDRMVVAQERGGVLRSSEVSVHGITDKDSINKPRHRLLLSMHSRREGPSTGAGIFKLGSNDFGPTSSICCQCQVPCV